MRTKAHAAPWGEAHQAACLLGQDQYQDPETGYSVFTERYLRARGYCCGSGCRHCPYGESEAVATAGNGQPDDSSDDSDAKPGDERGTEGGTE